MIKKKDLSKEDKEAWENFTKGPSDIYDKEKSNSSNILKKERFKAMSLIEDIVIEFNKVKTEQMNKAKQEKKI